MSSINKFFLGTFICTFSFSFEALAAPLKGQVKVVGGASISEFSLVSENTSTSKIISTDLSGNGKFTLSNVDAGDRLFILRDRNAYSPVVIAIKKGNKFKTLTAARKSRFCSAGNAQAIMATKGKIKNLKITVDTNLGVAYVSQALSKKNLELSAVASVDSSSCLPAGTSSLNSESIRIKGLSKSRIIISEDSSDADDDGVPNETDADDDNDGVTDTWDSDNDDDGLVDTSDGDNNDQVDNRVWNFQQLHLNTSEVYNLAIGTVSDETVDAGLVEHGGLAMQVISGTEVELDCGSGENALPYCSSGGTGRAKEPYPDGLALPDEMDADGDGLAEIEAGPTGDLQIAPGATSTEIRPGDAFIQRVKDSNGNITNYAGTINSVAIDVFGITSITTALGTNTFTYPRTLSTAEATYLNPIMVPSTGSVQVTVTGYPSHFITSAGRVVPGRFTASVNGIGGACVYQTGSASCVTSEGTSPGMIPGTLFSAPSPSSCSVNNDGVLCDFGTDLALGEESEISYTVNLTGTGGYSDWDSGETIRVSFMVRDNDGGTTGHELYFKRQ